MNTQYYYIVSYQDRGSHYNVAIFVQNPEDYATRLATAIHKVVIVQRCSMLTKGIVEFYKVCYPSIVGSIELFSSSIEIPDPQYFYLVVHTDEKGNTINDKVFNQERKAIIWGRRKATRNPQHTYWIERQVMQDKALLNFYTYLEPFKAPKLPSVPPVITIEET